MIDPEVGAAGLPQELLAQLASDSGDDPGSTLLAELQETPRDATAARSDSPGSREESPVALHESTARPPAVVPTPSPPRTRRFGADLSLRPSLGAGVQPGASFGVGLAARLRTPWPLSLELATLYWARRSLDHHPDVDAKEEGPDDTARLLFRTAQAAVSACAALLRRAPVELTACAGGALGVRLVDSGALRGGDAGRRLYAAPLIALEARFFFGTRWWLGLGQSLSRPSPRVRYAYTNVVGAPEAAYRTARFATWTSLEIGIRL